jgi:hypothetical protein
MPRHRPDGSRTGVVLAGVVLLLPGPLALATAAVRHLRRRRARTAPGPPVPAPR